MTQHEVILAELLDSISSKIKRQLHCCNNDECSNLSMRELEIIVFIGNDKKTMGEISEHINLTAGTTTTIIDHLIDKKFLKRQRDEKIDRRKIFIILNTKGKKIFNEHNQAKLKVSKAMMNSFSERQKDETIKLMKKIDNNLNINKEE